MKIRYYVTRRAWKGSRATWGYWSPCLKRINPKTGQSEPTLMAQLGFKLVDCGEDSPRAWAIAELWNTRWDEALAAHRRGDAPAIGEPGAPAKYATRFYPPGSLGEAFARFRKLNAWRNDKKPRTREDWWRGWDYIEPVFGDVDPRTVTLEDIDLWYGGDPDNAEIKGLVEVVGVREAHRAMKIWRALWRVVGRLDREPGVRYVDPKADPSLGVRRKTPQARTAMWYEGEAVRLVKRSWRMGYRGLAAALAVAWDTMLSPVDVRTLTTAQLTADGLGPLFSLERAKTGKAAIGTLSKRTWRLLAAYMETLPPDLIPAAPIFMTRGGKPGPKGGRPRPPVPYTADTLGDDFREVRSVEFAGDTRTVMDFRRSGAIETIAGEASTAALAGKMANSIDQSKELQATYLPHNATLVRLADVARAKGRARLRGAAGGGKEGK